MLYADDSVLPVCDKSPDAVSKSLATDLENCNNWLIDNKLSLHVGKTECILFGSKRKLKGVDAFTVKYKDTIISSTKTVKYLGVTLDNNLSGERMVSTILTKAVGKLNFLYGYGHMLSVKLRRKLCIALIQCHLDYCCTAWYNSLLAKDKC